MALMCSFIFLLVTEYLHLVFGFIQQANDIEATLAYWQQTDLDDRSCSMSGLVSNHLWVIETSWYVTSHHRQLNLAIPPWVGAMSSSKSCELTGTPHHALAQCSRSILCRSKTSSRPPFSKSIIPSCNVNATAFSQHIMLWECLANAWCGVPVYSQLLLTVLVAPTHGGME